MGSLDTDRWHANYCNKNKVCKWNPTILNQNILECDWEFIDKPFIARKCMCINEDICKQLVSLIDRKEFEQAEYLIDHIKKILKM